MPDPEKTLATHIAPAGEVPPADTPPATPDSTPPEGAEIDFESLDEESGKGKSVPVSALIRMRQEKNRKIESLQAEMLKLSENRSSLDPDSLRAIMRDEIQRASLENSGKKLPATAVEDELDKYDWSDPNVKPFDVRFKKMESQLEQFLTGMKKDKEQVAFNSEVQNVRKETATAMEKFPKARKEVLQAKVLNNPKLTLLQAAEEDHKTVEAYEKDIIAKYAAEKAVDNKGGGGPSGGQPPVTPAERIDIEDNPKGFARRLAAKIGLSPA